MLFGMVKHHMMWVFSAAGPFQNHERDLMRERLKHMHVPVDFGRRLEVTDQFKGWIMEDFMHFIKYAWPYVFQGIMTEGNLHLRLWRLLVDSTLHYLTPDNDPPLRFGMPAEERARNAAIIAGNMEEAAKKLRKYAAMLHRIRYTHKVPDDMFSSNLHMVKC
ncbi:uncharacterized protein HaLaN_29997, partial [Haematococcus lacustris]